MTAPVGGAPDIRTSLVADLIAALQLDDAEGSGFHQRCGLKEAPRIVRVQLLDQTLRDRVGGLGDIAAPRPAPVFSKLSWEYLNER